MSSEIAIAGTHSTGKTTLLENVGFPILRNHTFTSTLWIMTRGISLELEAGLSSDIILVDRPVPDALGYLLVALKFHNDYLTPFEAGYLEMLVKQHAGTYQRIFKTIIDETKPIDATKERDKDPIFRSQVAAELDSVF